MQGEARVWSGFAPCTAGHPAGLCPCRPVVRTPIRALLRRLHPAFLLSHLSFWGPLLAPFLVPKSPLLGLLLFCQAGTARCFWSSPSRFPVSVSVEAAPGRGGERGLQASRRGREEPAGLRLAWTPSFSCLCTRRYTCTHAWIHMHVDGHPDTRAHSHMHTHAAVEAIM